MADSGGICIFAAAFEQVKHKLSLGFEDVGAHEVKSFNEPLSVYRLVPGPVSVSQRVAQPAAENEPKPEKNRRRFRIPAKKTLAFGNVAAAAFFWFDSSGMPTVKEACNHVRVAEAKIREIGFPASLAKRALQKE